MRRQVQTVPLISEVSFLSGGTPRMSESRFWGGDIPWVSSGEMTESRISHTARRVTEDGARNGTRMVPANTVLVVVRGMSLAKEFRISISERELTFNQDIKALQPSEKIDPWFLFYYLKSQRHAIRDSATDASHGTKKLETRVLEQWPFPLLDITTQRSIASILSVYDDLIENNWRRIQLLEQAARLLYKEWFVHLRFPGHEHIQIIDSVPEGWENGVVSNFYDTGSGGTPSRKNPEFYGGTNRWVKTQELQDGFLFDTEEHITEDAIKKSAAKLFPANTVLIAMYGATIGQVGVIVEPSTCNQACCAVMPKAEGTSYEHAFLFFLSNKEGLRNLGQGAAQKNISLQVIRAYEMVFPDKLVLNMFRIHVEPFLGQIRTLQAMNHQLTKARDLLLPKLMSGEVAV